MVEDERWTEGLQSSWCMLPEKLGVMPRNPESFLLFHEKKRDPGEEDNMWSGN